ncbi:MAG: glycosyltransferase family 39 protein [Candidatus Pacebacteria bacterium]|nr:glycosyltransferase family 39 protein [Candidatus Paceibacterota bacterium]
MSNRLTSIIAACLLIFMFFLAVFSMKDDSATMDEVAHLPAGYSYLTQKDMRLNPEHPPLIKDLAALPLLFIKGINFPSEIKDWKEDINGQWGFGYHFLYGAGNPADQMIFWGRIPMVLILILLGFYIFKWARELFGNKTAVLSLFLFSFSPTFLAHGKLVTTDVGAAAGVLIATYYFIKFLKNSSRKNLILAGLALGFAQLLKFSVILLFPFFGILILVWAIINSKNFKNSLKMFTVYCLRFVAVLVVCFLLIGVVYQYHVWNYPKEKQASDTEFLLSSHLIKSSGPVLSWAAEKPILRPYAQYFFGLFLVFQRASFGHTTYFLGEISAAGWKNYFPIVYLIKETLVFHILTLIALLYAAWLTKKPFWVRPFLRAKNWIKSHFPEFAMLSFIGIYWLTSLNSDLNIGVRHLLPVFPFTILLVSATIIKLLKAPFLKIKYLILGVLILWQVFSVVSIYPHFLAYFNELAGGPNQGFVYTVDSNLDWGQDLKRLKKWVDENKIDKIYVDYFGGGDAKYYLKEKYASWQGTQDPNEFPKENYLAVSATFLQGGRGMPAPGFNQPWGYYLWLNKYTPVAKIGHSIFVYYID